VKTTFSTAVVKDDKVNATGLPVPAEAVAAMGSGKRPKVKVSLNGYTYCSTIAAYGEVYMLPLSAEHRQAAGVNAGDQIDVTIELDLEPRMVQIPEDLAAAMADQPGTRAVFDSLSYSRQKEFVRQVETAKAAETRERRITGIIKKLIQE
jgi:hypothetical protein